MSTKPATATNPPACGEIPLESRALTQAGVVLEGAMTLHYGDGAEQTLHSGELYAIAPGTTHGASFAERTTLVDVYTPNQTEFEARFRAMRSRGPEGDI